MDAKDFAALLRVVQTLTRSQRRKLMGALDATAAGEEAVALANGKMAGSGVACPHCFAPDPYRWGRKDEAQRYRCRAYSKNLYAADRHAIGAPEASGSLAAVRARKGRRAEPCAKAAAAANVHRTTSLRWRHRMLADAAPLKDTELSGIVEADETFFLESFKGSKAWAKAARGLVVTPPRPALRERGGVAPKRGVSCEQVPMRGWCGTVPANTSDSAAGRPCW